MIDTCVCCGEYVPEGRMVCPQCEAKTDERNGEDEGISEVYRMD